jgi:hypothetical protein
MLIYSEKQVTKPKPRFGFDQSSAPRQCVADESYAAAADYAGPARRRRRRRPFFGGAPAIRRAADTTTSSHLPAISLYIYFYLQLYNDLNIPLGDLISLQCIN